VIPSDERDTFGIADFESEEEEKCFDAVESTINKVA
jgi:hypothetical protein